MSQAILDDVFMSDVLGTYREWQAAHDVDRANVLIEDVEKILEAYQNQVEDNHALRERLYHLNHLTDSTFKDYMDLKRVFNQVMEESAKRQTKLNAYERELAESKAYADKLAEGLPVGMLPKDIEVMRSSNAAFAVRNHALERSYNAAQAELEVMVHTLEEVVYALDKDDDIRDLRADIGPRVQHVLDTFHEVHHVQRD